jgi:hypothetical protein
MHSAVEEHFRETENLIRQVPADDISTWLLEHGYFPESNVLPPSFSVCDFHLKENKGVHKKKIGDLSREKLCNISYPKTLLNSRVFSLQHPDFYHDAVIYLNQNWHHVVDHLFHTDLKIYSYSLPIPLNRSDEGNLGKLRIGRMIYEWLEMAEKDLVIDSRKYNFIVRTDITNFYPSVYTHSIGWALHGRIEAFNDAKSGEFKLYGNKIDRLFHYSNDGKTNGIPIGSALSDLIAEIILTAVDKSISQKMQENTDIDYLAVRFKDDYRVLCQTEDEGKIFLQTLTKELLEYNLNLNENKTIFLNLPEGLYRQHDREYFPHSLKRRLRISFKEFEHTLLIALEVHRKYPSTSILEKFLSEIVNDNYKLKIKFSKNNRAKEVKKAISLLILLQKESTKLLSNSLSLIELIYNDNKGKVNGLKEFLKDTIFKMMQVAAAKSSTFELVWLIFFSRYMGLGISEDEIDHLSCSEEVRNNDFYKSALASKQMFFKNTMSRAELFKTPKSCRGSTLAKRLDIFKRD